MGKQPGGARDQQISQTRDQQISQTRRRLGELCEQLSHLEAEQAELEQRLCVETASQQENTDNSQPEGVQEECVQSEGLQKDDVQEEGVQDDDVKPEGVQKDDVQEDLTEHCSQGVQENGVQDGLLENCVHKEYVQEDGVQENCVQTEDVQTEDMQTEESVLEQITEKTNQISALEEEIQNTVASYLRLVTDNQKHRQLCTQSQQLYDKHIAQLQQRLQSGELSQTDFDDQEHEAWVKKQQQQIESAETHVDFLNKVRLQNDAELNNSLAIFHDLGNLFDHPAGMRQAQRQIDIQIKITEELTQEIRAIESASLKQLQQELLARQQLIPTNGSEATHEQSYCSQEAVVIADRPPPVTEVTVARDTLQSLGADYVTSDGSTLLHDALTAAMVHICSEAGICVNTQNFAGDTALHKAVERGNYDVARALLINGADTTARNKLGQTALDMSTGNIALLIQSYRCGTLAALSRGDQPSMQRILRLWPNPDAVIKSTLVTQESQQIEVGVTALQLAKESCHRGPNFQACYNLLNGHLHTLRLVHAVLSENLEQVRDILSRESGCNINIRYKDKKGETLLSCAIEQHNCEIAELLLATGKCQLNIRVRENSQTDATVPLYFKTLEASCPSDLWRLIVNNCPAGCYNDRDTYGNTALSRAITNNKPADFIHDLLVATSGACLTHRNTRGMHARDVAQSLGRCEVIQVIDQYICDHPGNFLLTLPVAFYGHENLTISNKGGRCLESVAAQLGTQQDVIAIKQYAKVEALGVKLFVAAARGNVTTTAKLNTAPYQDKNGYTALTRAIVYNQLPTAEILMTARPSLSAMPDNNGRLPLHYAYALEEDEGKAFIHLLTERSHGFCDEHATDKDGREPAEYAKLRGTPKILNMINNARTLDAYCQPHFSALL